MNRFLFSVVALCAVCFAGRSQNFDYTAVAPHPRLILRDGDIEAVRELCKRDSAAMRLHETIVDKAYRYLNETASVRQKQGRRLLHISRAVLERVAYCSYMYLMTDDEIYAKRAEEEMLAAAAFEDWNPSHFLDVGEMTAALAIGYDWLYGFLSDESRTKIVDAIIRKGLLGAEDNKQMWFYRATSNWNQVCNGGLVMGALAVAERRPDLTESIIEKALATNPRAMRSYAPDGVYPEGFGYWAYGTWYEVLMIESLRSALGGSAGLERAEGFLASADFMNFMVAPSGVCYNFSDSHTAANAINPLLYWFAAETGNGNLVRHDRERTVANGERLRIESPRMLPFAILFASRCDFGKAAPDCTRFWSGRGDMPLFIYRDGDTYLAAKGGSPSHSHAHMDGGSFVYEWGGIRWAADLGSQNYYSLESRGVKLFAKGQDSPRWSVFRLSNASHNTLTINDKLHRYEGKAEMLETYSEEGRHGARFDLAPILFDVAKAERTITIDDGAKVTIEDDIVAGDTSCHVRWTMVTGAKPRITDSRTIELVQNGRKLLVRASSPKRIEAFVMSNDPPHDYDVLNPNTCRIGFLTDIRRGKQAVIKVELVPEK